MNAEDIYSQSGRLEEGIFPTTIVSAKEQLILKNDTVKEFGTPDYHKTPKQTIDRIQLLLTVRQEGSPFETGMIINGTYPYTREDGTESKGTMWKVGNYYKFANITATEDNDAKYMDPSLLEGKVLDMLWYKNPSGYINPFDQPVTGNGRERIIESLRWQFENGKLHQDSIWNKEFQKESDPKDDDIPF